MTNILSNEVFQERLKSFLQKSGITATELAKQLNLSGSTVRYWAQKGVKSESGRQKIVEAHPEIFSEILDAPNTTLLPTKREEVKTPSFMTALKSEFMRLQMQNMTSLLLWFLFEASVEDRNNLRENLGEEWIKFLDLTRAMTNEMSYDITLQEGRLEWFKKKN